MKIYRIESKLSEPGRTDWFHRCMFHGQKVEDPSEWHHGHFLGGDLSRPLVLIHNGWRIPDVFAPINELVVSAKVKAALAGLRHVDFLQVQFQKLISFPYQAGDFSYHKRKDYPRNPRRHTPVTLLDRLPDVPRLHQEVGDYYELVVARVKDVSAGYQSLTTVRFTTSGHPEDTHEMEEVGLSPAMLEDYPIVWWSSYLFHERAFALIDPFIDRDYFYVTELDLDEAAGGE